MTTHIPTFHDYLPTPLLAALLSEQVAVSEVPGLTVDPGLLADHPTLHTPEALQLVVDVFRDVAPALAAVLAARKQDRAFVDAFALSVAEANAERDYLSPDYETVIGAKDASGRVVVGPLESMGRGLNVTMPDGLAGPTVTLFGPPDDARMCINAMNAVHRKRADEPAIVGELVDASGIIPRWGADSEDSKTPFISDLMSATSNLRACTDGTLSFSHPKSGKEYALAADKLSVPIKRIPGLALPDGAHLLDGEPLPLHLVDFVLHAWLHRDRPDALLFYVPKLEDEVEAAYLAAMIRRTETRIAERVPGFPVGGTRLFIVFETPRAIFRIREMADALHPYLAGGSLGWHDFLAATARLFRHDPNYRIPVKADPNIVIHHIKESHLRLREALAPIGAIKIGGMYGTLFEDGNQRSFDVSMVGYVKDVVTQLRRGLDGFWVAHPDFVRIGIAIVAAWHRDAEEGGTVLEDLVTALITDADELAHLLDFLRGTDIDGHASDDPLYPRFVLAADIVESDVISNSDPEEVRYNVFQAIQYLAAWLGGEGCVALPAGMRASNGDKVFVRVMDDLATTERSRWELWAEVAHGRVSTELFESILAEELAFIRAGVDTPYKRVQVHMDERFGPWYPIAERILRQLVTDPEPVEAVSELLLPFTFELVRGADEPWEAAKGLCPGMFD